MIDKVSGRAAPDAGTLVVVTGFLRSDFETRRTRLRSLLKARLARLNCFGVGIALMLDQGELAHSRIGLARDREAELLPVP